VYMSTLSKVASQVHLDSVSSCLAVGPGEGLMEIRFIAKCAGNVNKLIAVEQDHESVQRLSDHLEKILPNVQGVMIESDFDSWKGPVDPVELVLLFHTLYYHRPDERKQFLQKLHDRWLVSGGFVVVLTVSHSKSPGNSSEIFERLGSPIAAWEDIEADVLEVGLIKQHEFEIQFKRDFSNPDESYLRFFQSHVEQPVTLDDIRAAINELYPTGITDQCFNALAVFQKTR